MKLLVRAVAIAAALFAVPVTAQSSGPLCQNAFGQTTPCTGTYAVDSTGAPLGPTNPQVVLPSSTAPAAWSTGATPRDVRSFSNVTLQVAGLSGGDTIAVTGSLDGTNYTALTGIDANFNLATTISANGIYSYSGGQYLKYAQTGSASTPTVTIRAGG
jgi:hypothetical protein